MANLDWTKIAGPLLGAGATVLGTIVGGPGGAAIGKAAGTVLAEVLGVPADPASVGAAIEADPEAAKAAADSPETAAAVAQAQAEMVKTVNETYRIELQSESWIIKYWRPVCGWCFTMILTVHGLAYAKALWFRDFEIIRTIPDMTVFYGVFAAVVGIYAWGRTAEKKAGSRPKLSVMQSAPSSRR
jgi:hypothetical protein